MSTADRANAFADMLRHDPDGWEHKEPTEDDYDAFQRWAITAYGESLYKAYMWPGWYDREDNI